MTLAASIFRCPACGKTHAVNAARAAVAYGRQLTCSPECESLRRRRMRGVASSAGRAGRSVAR